MSYVQRPFSAGVSILGTNYNVTGLEVASAPDYNAPYTVCGWIKLGPYYGWYIRYHTPVLWRSAVQFGAFDCGGHYGVGGGGPADQSPQIFIGINNTETYYQNAELVGGYDADAWDNTQLPVGPTAYDEPLFHSPWNDLGTGFYWNRSPWVHYAMVRTSGTGMSEYLNGQLTAHFTHGALTRSAADRLTLGARVVGSSYGTEGTPYDACADMKLAYWRVFDSALTQAQIAVEMGYTTAGAPSGGGAAWADWPLEANQNDVSGNTRHLVRVTPPARYAGTPDIEHLYEWDADLPAGMQDVAVLATVTTQAVTGITEHAATGNGTVVADGYSTITERGVCWSVSPAPTTADSKSTAAGTVGSFTAAMAGLAPAEHYYVRAYAINGVGTSYGSEVEFDTPAELATVTTEPVDGVTQIVAVGHGTVGDDGGSAITERGVCWSESPNPTTADSTSTAAGTVGVFSVSITGLAPFTAYHVRAYAVNAIGTSYGSDEPFLTSSSNPGSIVHGPSRMVNLVGLGRPVAYVTVQIGRAKAYPQISIGECTTYQE